MTNSLTRRDFLKQSSVFALGAAAFSAAPAIAAPGSPNGKVRLAVIGCNARGMAHIRTFVKLDDCQIVYVCDVDSRVVSKGIAAVESAGKPAPKGIADIRKLLEDKDVDAVSIAMPEHWHAPATIMACAAGKHVYIEKPGSHNPREAQLMVQAARKYNRVVQMGNQRRSWPWVIESIEALHGGAIGDVHFARGWYTNKRESIGKGKPAPVPDWLNYDLWQGPAPEVPFRDNILHYNWHWFWDWGTGEIGNNGVHALDLARWGLKVGLPSQISCTGGRYFYDDDWETPDTITATYDYGNKYIIWEGQSCAPRGFEGTGFGVSFFGSQGCLAMAGSDTKIFDNSNKVIREISGKQRDLFSFDAAHFQNFLDGIRKGATLRSEIEDGQVSTMMCHLGNISYRVGRTINYNPDKSQIIRDNDATKLWSRQYRKGWQPKV
jgi:predicted dehydrogenase